MQSGSKSETGGGDSLLPRLEALNLELLPTSDIKTYGSLPKVKPCPSRQTSLEIEILSNWYFYGRASCSNYWWMNSKDLPCSAVFLVTESESGKWIDFMIAIALFMGLKMSTALLMYWYWYFPAQINLTWWSISFFVLVYLCFGSYSYFYCSDQSDLWGVWIGLHAWVGCNQ